ncbi:glycosyltransferase family 39 protein [Candidatus Woesearchaeota archaeon]|nr:glycosyltransferase family 39 protein [Candidatus Woesearchaeota archaeon]
MNETHIALALLAIFFILSATAISQKSLTVDELVHIPAGYSYVRTLDFRLNPEHPPLMKILAGVFLLPLNPNLPTEHWSWAAENQQEFGRAFFFEANKEKHDTLLFLARLPMILVGMLLGWVVYRWSTDLFGARAGLASLALYTLSPNFLAHSALVATDAGVSTFLTLSTYLVWKWLKHPAHDWKTLSAIGAIIGLTLGAKFTGVYVIPIISILVLLNILLTRQRNFSTIARTSLSLCLMLIAAMITVSALYAFHDAPTYIKGLLRVSGESTEGRNSFLYGEYGHGWWYYFPLAFVVKMPIPTMIIFALAIVTLARVKKDQLFDYACLLLPALILFTAFMLNKINIGFRHVLPSLPFLFVLAGTVAKQRIIVQKKNIAPIITGILITWLAVETVAIYPDFLAYFNQFAGGPDNGYNYLMDSNIDWGQDLKGLKQWMSRHNVDKVTLGYFGQDDPNFRKIAHDSLKCYQTTGTLAVSVNILNGFRLEDRACTEWLRKLQPVDNIGHSILIYNIQDAPEKEQGIQDYCAKGCRVRCEKQNKTATVATIIQKKCVCQCT